MENIIVFIVLIGSIVFIHQSINTKDIHLFRHFPGNQSGDASGKIYLYDEVTKKVINSSSIPMISMTNEIHWTANSAYFKADIYPNISNPWRLPRPVKMDYTKIEELDTLKIIREFSSFDKLQSITIQKPISSCWKPINYESYDKNGNKDFEWQKQYSTSKESSCDFTSYIIHYQYYKNKKIVKDYFEHSACDDCETYSCGTKTEWDSLGNIMNKENYQDCNINFKPNKNYR